MDFATLAALPDDRIDVLTGALLIAKDEFPSLDIAHEKHRIDAISRRQIKPRSFRSGCSAIADFAATPTITTIHGTLT
jgi:hypothetical protein